MQIGATVGSGFRTAVQSSQGQLNRIGSTLDDLKSKQKAIRRFELGQADVRKASTAFIAASRDVKRLGTEVARTNTPSRQLVRSFDAARQKADRLSRRLVNQREKLRNNRVALERSGVSTRNLARDNDRLGASVAKLTRRQKALGAALNAQQANRSRQSELRGQLFDAVAIGAVVAAPIKIAADFEQSVARLGAITRNAADSAGLVSLTDQARRLGEETQFRAREVTEGMTFLGMAGFQTNEIIAATPGLLDLALGSSTSLADTADITSNILSGFAIEATEMERVSDVLAATVSGANVNLRQLGDTLKFTAPVAKDLGVPIETVAALAGKLGDAGLQGTLGGTTLRSMLLRLAAPTAGAKSALAELGIEVENENGKLKEITVLLGEFFQATQGVGDLDRTRLVNDIFGKTAVSGVSTLLQESTQTDFKELLDTLQRADADNIGKKMADQLGDTATGSIKRLGSAMESLAISVGGLLLPTVATMSETFAGFASGASRLAQRFPFLTKMVIGLTVGLVALRVVTIASVFSYTFLKGAVLSLRTAYVAMNVGLLTTRIGLLGLSVLSSLTAAKIGIVTAAQWAWNIAMTANPIGLIVIGIGALIGAGILLVKHWDTVKDFFGNLWDGIKEVTGGAVDWLLEKIKVLLNPFGLLVKAAKTVVGAVFGDGDEDLGAETASGLSRNRRSRNVIRSARSVALGATIASSASLAAPAATVSLPDDIQSANTIQNTDSVRIDAPITIQSAPGMDERMIAQEVTKALDAREARGRARRRARLSD